MTVMKAGMTVMLIGDSGLRRNDGKGVGMTVFLFKILYNCFYS
jgi:hypothetical protein